MAPVRAGDQPLAIPLVVVTRGVRERWPVGWPVEEVERQWRELQADLVTRSSQGSQVIADKSGYNIPLTQPEVITAAIRQVSAAARR